MVFSIDDYCEECGVKYTNVHQKWCKLCQINNLRKTFTNWTSGNEKIDDFIQEKQLKIKGYRSIIFEWIPYNQFNDIKESSKNDLATICSAMLKDGLLEYTKE